ncbi:MAG: DUF6290 family protein [Chloroflexota bacterium]
MTRILVSIPDDLHDILKEVAVRKRASLSKLILAAIEDSYEDDIDAVAGERALAEDLADPSGSISFEELSKRLRAKIASRNGTKAATTKPPTRRKATAPGRRKKSGVSH